MPNLQVLLAEHETRGKIKFQGLTIRIENPRDSVRSGVDKKTGRKWATKMTHPYGYIEGTKGVDGDEVDCFVGPDKDADYAHVVHILNQNTGELDEDKVMLGWHDAMEAKRALLQNYDGKEFYGGLDSMPMAEFKKKVLATESNPTLIKASQLERAVALHAGKGIGIGSQVIVDGIRKIGEVIAIQGDRFVVRFRDGISLSRDKAFVHPYDKVISGMWKDRWKTV